MDRVHIERIEIAVVLPVAVAWAFIGTLVRGMREAFIDAWLHAASEISFARDALRNSKSFYHGDKSDALGGTKMTRSGFVLAVILLHPMAYFDDSPLDDAYREHPEMPRERLDCVRDRYGNLRCREHEHDHVYQHCWQDREGHVRCE